MEYYAVEKNRKKSIYMDNHRNLAAVTEKSKVQTIHTTLCAGDEPRGMSYLHGLA